jgi:hypothetical protein
MSRSLEPGLPTVPVAAFAAGDWRAVLARLQANEPVSRDEMIGALEATTRPREPESKTEAAMLSCRREIKDTDRGVTFLLGVVAKGEHQQLPDEDRGQMIANLTLAHRHLEDASMRVGKAIQAHNGGRSVYDRETTVGA